MTTMNPRQWFQARLKWAVLEEGYGLTHWRESEHIFLSENRDAAFQEALRLGYAEEHSLIPNEDDDRNPVIDCRFAEVVYLRNGGWDEPLSKSTWGRGRGRLPNGSTLITYSIQRVGCRNLY